MISKPVSGSKSISITMVNATSPRRLNWTIDARTQYQEAKKTAVRKHCRLLRVTAEKLRSSACAFQRKHSCPLFALLQRSRKQTKRFPMPGHYQAPAPGHRELPAWMHVPLVDHCRQAASL